MSKIAKSSFSECFNTDAFFQRSNIPPQYLNKKDSQFGEFAIKGFVINESILGSEIRSLMFTTPPMENILDDYTPLHNFR